MKVPIFDLKYTPEFIDEYCANAAGILNGGFLTEGVWTTMFEVRFAEFVSAKHAIAVTSGTAALELAFKAVGASGGEVIMPSNTFFATAVAAVNAGATPVLADMEFDAFSIDINSVKSLITPKTKAVVIVHIGGIVSNNISELVDLCKLHNIALIEDAAHAHGSFNDKGDRAGSIGDIACFSFFPTKVMTTGEGGMVTTNDLTYDTAIRSLKNFGRETANGVMCVNPGGNNYKVNELTSMLGVLELRRAPERIERRRYLAELYADLLHGSYMFSPVIAKGSNYYKLIVTTTDDVSNITQYCKDNTVALTGAVYAHPVHTQPVFKEVTWSNLSNTQYFKSAHICPPLYPELTDEQVTYVAHTLHNYEKSRC